MARKRSSDVTAQGGRDTALRLLARREHAAAELKHKLQRRGHDTAQAEAIVDGLAESGWQSNERYAETLVRSRIAAGYGPLRIRAELEMAQVADDLIRAAVAAAAPDWTALAQTVHARKFKTPPQSAAEWQKHYRYLAARGFESAQIRAVLKGAEPEDI